MSFDLSQNALLKYLNDQELKPVFQKETSQIYLIYEINNTEVPVFLGIRQESSLLQILAYLPYQLHEKAFGDTARMLHLLNKELDMPGFGMDEKEKLIFYRSVIPCLDAKVSSQLLNMHLATTRLACETFMYAIGVIASGTVSADEMMKNKMKGSNP